MKKVFQKTGRFQLFIALTLLVSFLVLAVAASMASTEKKTQPAPVSKVQQAPSDTTQKEQKFGYATESLGTILTGDNARKQVFLRGASIAGSQASQAVQQWLSQVGTAKVNINVNDNFAMQDSSLDWLIPLYDNKRNMLFTQLGARRVDSRDIFNLGWGWRANVGNWLYGFNNFFDHDYVHENWRSSIGLEAWTHYLQFSANRYMRMNGWHQSAEFADYNERPAGGFDLRIKSYLPVYPQLGSNLMFERYFGDQVALFGNDNLQKDPYAFTFGLNYTPIPLLTFGVDKKVGKSGKNDTNLNMQLTYRFSDPLSRQLSTTEVDTLRRLSKSRYDLVDRNNNIILEYEEQSLITLSLDQKNITKKFGEKVVLTGIVKSKYPLSSIQWVAPDFQIAGGSIRPVTLTTFEITLPSSVTDNIRATRMRDKQFQLVATAYDIRGNASKPVNLLVNLEFSTSTITTISLAIGVNNSPADNTSANQVSATLLDGNNNPIPGEIVTFTANNSATVLTPAVPTNSAGVAIANLTSTVAGTTTVTASTNDATASIDTIFIANESTATILAENMIVTSDNALANDIATNAVQVRVTDINSNPVPSASVSFSANNGATIVTTPVITDANGIASTTLHNTHAGTTAVTATVNGHSQSVNTSFTPDISTPILAGNLTVTSNNALANNVATNAVQVLVTDQYNNPLPDVTVNFTATNGATVNTPSVTSDANGIAATTLRSTTAGNSTVTATLVSSGAQLIGTVTFLADPSTAILADNLTVTSNNALANNVATDAVQVLVTDQYNNPLSGIVVNFSASNGATVDTPSVTSNTNGIAATTLRSTTAGSSTVTATLATTGAYVNGTVTFVADPSTPTLTGDLTVTDNNAIANNVATNAVQVLVTDQYNNPLPDVTINFTASHGATVDTPSVTSDANGIATTTLRSTTAGNSTVTATLAATGAYVDGIVTFVADPNIAILTGGLTVSSNNAVANNVATDSVQVLVTDQYLNPLSGVLVNFNASNNATVDTRSAISDVNGIATTTLRSTKAGNSTVTATLATTGAYVSGTVTFVADPSTPIMTNVLTVTSNNALANNVATDAVQLLVTDQYLNPLSGVVINFSATNDATVVTSSVTSDASGIVATTLRSTKAGNSTVTATLASTGSQLVGTVTFSADPNTATLSGSLTVNINNALANDVSRNNVQVMVTDQYLNPLPGFVVNFTATNGATVVTPSVTSNANGVAITTLRSTVAGDSTVTATLDNTSSNLTGTVTFVADPSTAILTGGLMVISNNAVANNVATNTVQVQVVDLYLNPLSGFVVNFTANNSATVVTPSVTSNANGIATTTLISTTAGNSTVTATLVDNDAYVFDNVTFVGNPATAQATLTVLTDNALADGIEDNQVQVTVLDAYNNPVENLAVTFSATNGATANPATANTNASGQLISYLTNNNGTGGTSTVTATLPNGNFDTESVNFTGLILTGINTPANPHLYALDEGFPTTASNGLYFQFRINQVIAHNSSFNWSSSNSNAASIDSAGIVTFHTQPSGSGNRSFSVTFIGALKTNPSYVVTYTTTIDRWFYGHESHATNFTDSQRHCSNPLTQRIINDNDLSIREGTRGIGGILDEWGNIGSYHNASSSINDRVANLSSKDKAACVSTDF